MNHARLPCRCIDTSASTRAHPQTVPHLARLELKKTCLYTYLQRLENGPAPQVHRHQRFDGRTHPQTMPALLKFNTSQTKRFRRNDVSGSWTPARPRSYASSNSTPSRDWQRCCTCSSSTSASTTWWGGFSGAPSPNRRPRRACCRMAELLFIASKLLHPRPAAAARRHRVSFGSVRAAARLSCMPALQRHGHGRRRQRRGRCCRTKLRTWRSRAAAEPSRGGSGGAGQAAASG